MYGDTNFEFNFSIVWLERFKERDEIKSYRRFGESGSVVMENIKDVLRQIRVKLENFGWKDIYNMDETCVFYRLQVDHSRVTKQLEGQKKDKKRLTIVVCCNGDDFVRWFDARTTGRKVLLIVDNCLAHPKILNYPSENESLMESPTDEEIIQGVLDVAVDDKQDPNDSSVLPYVSPKE
ncbi:hypothetical protein Goshw_014835, partial [Gossypium schwendimanii]|nr:hypothetical protein [Gossypium schwendimanii]